MRVEDVMTATVQVVSPQDPVRQAAALMAELDAGVAPVQEGERLVGMVTDRDIALRVIAAGRGPETPVAEAMTPQVKFCYADEDVDAALRYMRGLQVRRLPVLDRDEKLVGILSLGDIAFQVEDPEAAGEALSGISEPGGEHSQTGDLS